MTVSQLSSQKDLSLIFLEDIQAPEVTKALWSVMAEQGHIASAFGTDQSASTPRSIQHKLQTLKPESVAAITSALAVGLPEIYTDKKKKASLTLNFCIISISLAFLLLLVGLSVAFRNSSSQQLGLITSAASLVPTFLSATFFFVYKRADKNLQLVEREITKIKVLESFSAIASNLPDPDLAAEAYRKLISQMDR